MFIIEDTHYVPPNRGILPQDASWTPPNWDAIEPHEDPKKLAFDMASETISKLLGWCWRRTSRDHLTAVFRRFAVASRALNPELFDSMNYRELAALLGCTKANVSKVLGDFASDFRVHLRERSASSVRGMREARLHQVDGSGRVIGRNVHRRAKKTAKQTARA